MVSNWDYGGAFERHPIHDGVAVFENGSRLTTHDIFRPIPNFIRCADMLFVDPPWNKGNLSTFYTKANLPHPEDSYTDFYRRLFQCIYEVSPTICYIEIGKEYLADFIINMREQFKYVTFYNSTYYHNKNNLCYVVRGSNKSSKPKLDGVDEEDIINWVCANESYSCIGDLCMGRGLVALGAYRAHKQFVGTELNHKRLSVAIESLCNLGAKYTIE